MGLFDLFKGIGKKKPALGKPGMWVIPTSKNKTKVDAKIRWDMQARSGQGSMSKVWRAYDRSIGRTVCLKLLDKDKTAKFEARFIGRSKPPEGDVCMRLSHRNIVKTFEWGVTTANEIYLVMEWIEGVGLNFMVETHSQKLRGHELDILIQLTEAVEYLHHEKFLHRDLCPRNVMVTNDNVVKLIDFGLTIPYRPEFCTPGNRTGTPDYLAPEIIKRQSTDHRVDLFALGVTAFEVFTNGLPWPKSAASQETLQKHLNSRGRDPRELRPELDQATHDVLVQAIERDVKDRYQTAAEFKSALQALKVRNHA